MKLYFTEYQSPGGGWARVDDEARPFAEAARVRPDNSWCALRLCRMGREAVRFERGAR